MQHIEVSPASHAAAVFLGGIKSKWILVSPNMARGWLAAADQRQTATSRNNRNRSAHTVSAYARDMTHHHWVITHQGIAFDVNGILIDGQHRLAAIVESCVPQVMLVTFGLPAEAKLSIDRGRIRAVADQLQIFGDADATLHAVAVCRALNALRAWTRRDELSTHEIAVVLDQYRDAIVMAERWTSHKEKLGPRGYRAALVGAVNAHLGDQSALHRIEVFARIVREGNFVPMDWDANPGLASTPLALRKVLTGEVKRTSKNGGDMKTREREGMVYASTERAIKAFLDNVALQQIRAQAGQAAIFPLRAPNFDLFPG